MKKIAVSEALGKLETLGRTYLTEDKELYCNWTCSGVRLAFCGTALAVEMKALPGFEQELNPMTAAFGTRELLPWAAVFLDGAEEPYLTFEVKKQAQFYPVFQCEQPESHVITLRKLTENAKGKLCLTAFLADGEIGKPPAGMKKSRIEFVGDSITCGFGNMVNDPGHPFYTQDENGWMSHAAVAARLLDAEFSIVACSGIAATEGIGKIQYALPPMKHYYPYRDRMLEEAQGKGRQPLRWEFAEEIPNAIVVNLGTNDATVIDLNGDIPAGIRRFEQDYYEFLQLLRDCNGDRPWIVCALGSLDYFLYDSIQRVAEKFGREKQDGRIRCFRYNRVRVSDPLGACRHPHAVTQIRMGEELAAYLKGLLSAT